MRRNENNDQQRGCYGLTALEMENTGNGDEERSRQKRLGGNSGRRRFGR